MPCFTSPGGYALIPHPDVPCPARLLRSAVLWPCHLQTYAALPGNFLNETRDQDSYIPMPPEDVKAYMTMFLRGVDFCHQNFVLHRDLKVHECFAKPQTPNPKPQTPNPKSQTPNPKPQPGPKPLNPKP